jgi:hypothetical protein
VFWLACDTPEGICVILQPASSLVHARLVAAMNHEPGTFSEGHELQKKHIRRIPKKMIGRCLSPRDAQQILKLLEAYGVRPARARCVAFIFLNQFGSGRDQGVEATLGKRCSSEFPSSNVNVGKPTHHGLGIPNEAVRVPVMERTELLRRLEQVEQEVSQTLELVRRYRNILAEFGRKEVDVETIQIMLTQLEERFVFQLLKRERLRAELNG